MHFGVLGLSIPVNSCFRSLSLCVRSASYNIGPALRMALSACTVISLTLLCSLIVCPSLQVNTLFVIHFSLLFGNTVRAQLQPLYRLTQIFDHFERGTCPSHSASTSKQNTPDEYERTSYYNGIARDGDHPDLIYRSDFLTTPHSMVSGTLSVPRFVA